MNLWSEIESGSDIPDVVTAVIEVPKGSRNKYEYDKEKEAFMLDRVLYSPVVYPADYGFIPKSIYDDGENIRLDDHITVYGCNSRSV